MVYFWLIILIILNTMFMIMVPFALPGNWLMLIATTLFAWIFAEHNIFSFYTLLILLFLAIIGEIFEFLGGAGGAKKSGARILSSIAAILGAIIGSIVGTFMIPIPVLGTVLGSCLGAGLAAWTMEIITGPTKNHIKIAKAAALGQLIGTTSKSIVAIIIWLTITLAAIIN